MAVIQEVSTLEGLRDQLATVRRTTDGVAALCNLGGDLSEFVNTVFDIPDLGDVYGQVFDWEPQGDAASFDDGRLLDNRFPWVAVYNFSGQVSLRATVLPPSSAESYFGIYPDLTQAALQARRHLASTALRSSGAEIYEGLIESGTGLVLPQKADGPHIVHETTPLDPSQAGTYVRVVLPADTAKARTFFERAGYRRLDSVVDGLVTGVRLADIIGLPSGS